MVERLAFPEGFRWGTATSSHQVEGGNENNDWWAWEQAPGHIMDGSCSGRAADWWHRAEEDLRAAQRFGHNTHRLSVEWSRLEPEEGAWDEAAVARYRAILSAMRDLGIEPMITLHHFSNPLWLAECGAWENPKVVGWFSRFCERVVTALGDLCTLWCTINEPMVYITYGYVTGEWPPGSGGLRAARVVLAHMAQAHAAAYEAIHRLQPQAQVGYAKHMHLFDPANPRHVTDRLAAGLLDRLFNESALAAFDDGTLLFPLGSAWLKGQGARHLDFIGLNYYSRSLVELDLRRRNEMFVHRFPKPDAPYGIEGWGEIYPEGLYRSLKRLAAYGLPIYVTEFGVPDNDDSLRPRFIVEHVAAMHRAVQEGVPLRGAYFWSLVDNFEWAAGWIARFGLIRLDPATQERRINPSARVYARIAQANALERDLVAEVTPDLVSALFG